MMFDGSQDIDQIKFISAGKLRRFHGESWRTRISDVRRNLLNLRDSLRLLTGCAQSFWLLLRHRPQVIFIKGGYVGVPVGLCAWLLRIPYITHDSDALAGLSNRLIGRGARLHAVGMSKDAYNNYPAGKTIFTGVPVGEDFHTMKPVQNAQAKAKLGIPPAARVVLITGGSNGAQRLNMAMRPVVQNLLDRYSDLWIIHQFGSGNEGLYQDFLPSELRRVKAEPFLKPMSGYSAAADLIVTRAGATTLAEFAAQYKACVVVPNPYLTGGHQSQNAKALAAAGAAAIVREKDMRDTASVAELLGNLLDKPGARLRMGASLHRAMPPNAAEKLAVLILQHAAPGGQRK